MKDGKVSLRNIRRDCNDQIKKSEKDSEFSEDESRDQQENVQKLTNKFINEIETDWDLVHTQMYKRSTEIVLVLECSAGIKIETVNKFPEIETRITNRNCRLELLTSVFD